MSDVSDLRDRARAGDPAAQFALGRKLLIGEGAPAAPQEGAALIASAAAHHGEAAALHAVFAAWGVFEPRDFSAALARLQRAAELGHEPAAEELALLARGGAIDLAALAAPPPPREVSEAPRVQTFERFAAPAECDWLIATGGAGMRRARVYQGSADLKADETRTNSEADFTIFKSGLTLALIRARMEAAVAAPAAHFEVTKLLHYTPGQTFALHADFLETSTPALRAEIERRGQRVATLLIYLNDGYEGGETDFPKLDFRFRGAKGDALLFANVSDENLPDYRTLHAGLPPTSGEKWLLSQWIRSKPVAP